MIRQWGNLPKNARYFDMQAKLSDKHLFQLSLV